MRFPHLFTGIRRPQCNLLFYGPPGTGAVDGWSRGWDWCLLAFWVLAVSACWVLPSPA